MNLKKTGKGDAVTLYVKKSYRDPKKGGKSTSKLVERLGTLDEVRERSGGKDPMEWAEEYVAKLTAEEKAQRRVICPRMHPDVLIKKGELQSVNCGYLFLQKLYYKLKLDNICHKMEKDHNFDYDLNAVLEILVYGRIIAPASKLSTHKTSNKYVAEFDVELHHVYRSLDVIAENFDYIQKRLYKNSINFVKRDTTVLYYDCTNYFYETEKADPVHIEKKADGTEEKTTGYRQFGASKEHRPNPIVQMGMFIDKTGFPLAMCINPGNTNEQVTLIPTERKIIEGMGVEKIVVCTDGGLSSEGNRAFNSTADRSFITVQSLKKLNKTYREWALQTKGWKLIPIGEKKKGVGGKDKDSENEENKEFDLSEKEVAEQYGDRTFYRERWIINEETNFSQRLIVTFSFKYRDYLRNLRNRLIERDAKLAAKGGVCKKSPYAPGKYIKETYATKDGEEAVYRSMALNLEAIADEEKYDGFYGICTDLNNPVKEIIQLNHNRWESEDCFRVLKTDFKARPAFVWTDNHIKAHFLICFIALLIFRIMESELDHAYTSTQIISTLREMTLNIIHGEGYRPNYTRTDLTDALHEIAGFRTDTEIVTYQKMKSIKSDVKKS